MPGSTAPSPRRGAVDLARVGALVLVVLGHLSMAVIDRGADGALRGANVLSLHPGAAWLAMLSPMPVFFAAGGWANATSGVVAGASRVRRIVGLAAVVVAIWWCAVVAERLVAGDDGVVTDGARLATQPFWFLAAYVPFAVGGATMSRLARRPLLAVSACLLVLAALDVARFAVGAPEAVGWPGFLAAWAVPWLLGAAWRARHDADRLDRGREVRGGLVLAAAAAVAAVALVRFAGYFPSLIDAVEGERSNTTPPTLFTAVAGMVQVGLLMAAAGPLDRAAARGRRFLDRAGEVSIGVYAWHLTGLALCAAALAAGLWAPVRFGAAWWLTRPLWFGAVLGVTAVLVLATDLLRRRMPTRRRAATGAARAWVGVVVSAMGAAAVGRWGPRTPAGLVVSLAGLVAGWWLLGGARGPVAPRPPTPSTAVVAGEPDRRSAD